MKNFHNCEPYQLKRDLQQLIIEHTKREANRRIEADQRLQQLKNGLDEVTTYIAIQSIVGETP